MAGALVGPAVLDCAPGNSVSLAVTGLQPGPVAVAVANQGGRGVLSTIIVGTASVITNGAQTVTFAIPDGLSTGAAIITDGAVPPGSVAVGLRVASQYVQASEYAGEGIDLTCYAPGDLDIILRRASAYVDSSLGGTLRLMQYFERHDWRRSRKIWPEHRPIVSLDDFAFVTSNSIRTEFSAADIYVNADDGYIDVLAFAFGNYALLGVLETVGFSADVIEILITCGYPMLYYPQAIRDATALVATSFLTQAQLNRQGMAGLSSLDGMTRDSGSSFDRMPGAVRRLLRPFRCTVIR